LLRSLRAHGRQNAVKRPRLSLALKAAGEVEAWLSPVAGDYF